jgi:hypothetical protein
MGQTSIVVVFVVVVVVVDGWANKKVGGYRMDVGRMLGNCRMGSWMGGWVCWLGG